MFLLFFHQSFILFLFVIFISAIKNYDYDKPEWTQKDGTFIQIVYSTISKFSLATASFDNQIFVVGRYDQPIYISGPFDLKHVPKPKQSKSPLKGRDYMLTVMSAVNN